MMANSSIATVVPAFERFSKCETLEECQNRGESDADFIPSNLGSLRKCLHEKRCATFHSKSFAEGHSTTRSLEWARSSASWRQPRSLGCLLSTHYEPYLILPSAPTTPQYDERFVGYGQNKRQFNEHLRYAGFVFQVLPREFVVHYPHPKSAAKEEFRHNRTHGLQNSLLFADFACNLTKTHPIAAKAKVCA
jgi:hypothetical protein